MLTRVIVAIDKKKLERHVHSLISQHDVMVETVSKKSHLLERVSRESSDLIIISQSLIPEPVFDTINLFQQLPDAPGVIIISERKDPEEQAQFIAAGCDAVVHAGERNLLSGDFGSSMERLKRLFEVFEQKTSLVHLLDISQQAHGVQIYIGGESGIVPLDEMSVVTAPYAVDGQVIGTLGVIGPTRMAYERVIPIVDITAKLLSNALTHKLSD